MPSKQKRAAFSLPENSARPIHFIRFPDLCASEQTYNALRTAVEQCHRIGGGALIPLLPEGASLDVEALTALKDLYGVLLSHAAHYGLTVGFCPEAAFEQSIVHAMDEIKDHSLRAGILTRKEYSCQRNTLFRHLLSNGERMALLAYCEDTCEVIDLRSFVQDGELCWQVPSGNYVVHEYLSVPDTARERINYLSYQASVRYLHTVYSYFEDTFAPYLNKTLTMLAYRDIGFGAQNRRDWDEGFNKTFETQFGFDPAPHYPALFGSIGQQTEHLRACFMATRATMLREGILRAMQDFAAELGLTLFGSLCEPKLTACSFTVGDAMLNNTPCPCALFEKAYMYGTNSVKIAAGTAYSFDIERVCAELFRDYTKRDSERLYKDAMNAFARGINCTALHLPDAPQDDSSFCDFAARVQTMLRGGAHMADIAMLYPIYHLHSNSGLYFSNTRAYEYPATPSTADYMTLINAISIYAGHDLTLLHPTALQDRCHTEGGVLYLDNKRNKEAFRVVVLPATSMISLANLRLLKAFYDGGGKLLATGMLPSQAFEPDETGENDALVRTLVRDIFGERACNPHVMQDYCHNRNSAGGEALFLYFNASASDGTRMTRSSTVNAALNAFDIPFDIYLPGMPRLEITGALNASFPEFSAIGLDRTMPGGGMLNHLHKHYEDYDVYYFSNTTKSGYDHHVLLRGALEIEEWNPYNGSVQKRVSRILRYKDTLYTNLRLTLPPCTSTFFVATPLTTYPDEIECIESIHRLQSEQATLMSEF